MVNAKRILIETESRETVVVRTSTPRVVIAYCESCAIETEMLDLNSAVTRSGCGALELIHEIDAGRVHSSQTPSGHLLICANFVQRAETFLKTGEELIRHE